MEATVQTVQQAKQTQTEAFRLFRALARLVPATSHNPVFTYLYLEPLGDKVRVSATDEIVDAFFALPIAIQGAEGPIYVPARLVRELLKEVTAPRFSVDGSKLVVEEGNLRARLDLGRFDEGFPAESLPDGFQPGVRTRRVEFVQALRRVLYAVSNEQHRAIFRGVQVELRPSGRGRAVASDGYRLAMAEFPLEGAEALEPVARVLQKASLSNLIALLEELEEDTLELVPAPWGLWILAGEHRLLQRAMAGEFPDYERVIPKQFPFSATVTVGEVRRALRRIQPFAPANHRLDLRPVAMGFEASVLGDFGGASEVIPAQTQGEPFPLSFNLRYLMEAFSPLEDEAEVRLEFSGTDTPALVRPLDGTPYQAVVVPLRV